MFRSEQLDLNSDTVNRCPFHVDNRSLHPSHRPLMPGFPVKVQSVQSVRMYRNEATA